MPKSNAPVKDVKSSFRMSRETDALLTALERHFGQTRSDVLNLAIRKLSQLENVKPAKPE